MDSEFEGWEDFSMSRLQFVSQDGANGCKLPLFYVFIQFVRETSHTLSFTASVVYYYFYKRTAEYLGDPRLYEDSPWLRDVFAQARY